MYVNNTNISGEGYLIFNYASNRIALCLLIVASFLLPLNNLIAQTWPTDSDWVPMIDNNWEPLQDADEGHSTIEEIIPDEYGNIAYFYYDQTTLFVRMTLQSDPIDRRGLKSALWQVYLDQGMDGFPDWLILADGINEELITLYNGGQDADPEIQHSIISRPVKSKIIREVNAGYSIFSLITYLDIQVPLTSLQISGYDRNIIFDRPLKIVCSTNADIGGDYSSISDAFASVPQISKGHYGVIHDAGDPLPYSNEGVYKSPDVISLQGEGWPTSSSPYFNGGVRNIRILSSNYELAWFGSVSTDASGYLAPDFTLNDENEQAHHLADYVGQDIVVYFYPKDDTPGCVKEACSIRDGYSLFEERKIKVFGISYDTAASHKKFKDKHNLPFTLLSDTSKSVAKQYGSAGLFLPKRKTFLINKEGLIFKTYNDVDVTSHADDILNDFQKYYSENP
jgi:thioredoxin-dependent peroxiredoxin